jgi:hypothetical protein
VSERRPSETPNPIAPWRWHAERWDGSVLAQYGPDGYHSPSELDPATVRALVFTQPRGVYRWEVPTAYGPLAGLAIHVDRAAQLTGGTTPAIKTVRIRAEYAFTGGMVVLTLLPEAVEGTTWVALDGRALALAGRR